MTSGRRCTEATGRDPQGTARGVLRRNRIARDRFEDFAAVYAETLERLHADAAYNFGPDNLRRLADLDDAYLAVALLDGQVAGAYLFFERDGIVQLHLGGTRSAYMGQASPSKCCSTPSRCGRSRATTRCCTSVVESVDQPTMDCQISRQASRRGGTPSPRCGSSSTTRDTRNS